MKNAAYISLTLIVAISPTLAVEAARAQSATDVSQIAQQITAIIDGDDKGSATLIGRQGTTYTVITNWHVLRSRGNFSLRTHDNQTHTVIPSSIQRVGNFDLALAKFVTNRNYLLATIGNNLPIPVGASVYVAGAPANLQGIDTRTVLVVPGSIVGTEPSPQEGYETIYNNNTMPGMSGGAVLNANGYLVAIHGRGTRDSQAQKAGFNLGIPIRHLSPTLLSQVGATLAVRPPTPSIAPPPVVPTVRNPRIPSNIPSSNIISPGNRETGVPSSTYVPSRPATIDGSSGVDGACTGSRCR
jgi:serine protease Do